MILKKSGHKKNEPFLLGLWLDKGHQEHALKCSIWKKLVTLNWLTFEEEI